MNPDSKKWYAIYTKPRCEKKVSETLTKKGIENYCPLNRIQRQWSDRKKIVYEPLFTSYVFVNIDSGTQLAVRQTYGVLNFVYWLNKPAIIRTEEIDMIKRFLNEYSSVRLEVVKFNINDSVRIVAGAFMEQEGKIISVKSKTVKIMLPSLGYWMHAEIEMANVKVIMENSHHKDLFLVKK
ncbi:MAG: UpxY family transcription antiterminator [Ferruginibacter sp.]